MRNKQISSSSFLMPMLQEKDYIGAANFLGCEVAAIKAVSEVEAPRGAYDSDGHITILFEPYVFYKELRRVNIDPQPLIKEFPTLISPKWNPKIYGSYNEQWDKLRGAANIDAECAYRSASYGLFQILGNNAEDLGYKDVFEFYYFLRDSEHNQLIAFCKYIKRNLLDDELRNKDWKGFSKQYNGPLYHKNYYDTKLEKAYEKYASTGS